MRREQRLLIYSKENYMANPTIIELLREAILQPKEVKNDAGRVEMHDLDKITEALQYLRKEETAEGDPFLCMRQTDLPHKDCWASADW